jgi:CheY-like chemotaxis protein
VVDDDPSIRDSVAAILEKHGYRVIRCSDGVEAIAVFNAHLGNFSLVITDVDMPHLGGVALASALLRLRPDIRLLAMSGLSHGSSGGLGIPTIRELADGFLHKPFVAEDLLGIVHCLLHPSQMPGTAMSSILLIDDNVLFRTTLANALTQRGYTVSEASDGEQGAKRFRINPTDLVILRYVRHAAVPQLSYGSNWLPLAGGRSQTYSSFRVRSRRHNEVLLVITDIVMPNRDGTSAVAELRRDFPNLGIIAMSGGRAHNAPLYLQIAKAFGANRTLIKPFTNAAMLQAIGEVLADCSEDKPAAL